LCKRLISEYAGTAVNLYCVIHLVTIVCVINDEECQYMKQDFIDKINEIVDFAQKHDRFISRNTVIDILKNKEDAVDDAQINEAINQVIMRGITVGPEHDEGYPDKEAANDSFIPAEVNIGQKPLNVYNLMERLENNEIDLNPGFQRQGNIWTLEAQSRLIESLMLKIPIPAFYFDAADDDQWVVIDGLQRLCAFQNYLIGKISDDGTMKKEKFRGLEYLKDFNNITFDDLPRQYIRRIKETSIIAFTVEKGTPDQVVYNIFQRINTGGMVLNDQEIRQALYQGKATKLIQNLAESDEFKLATQNAISADRMIDREYVTRFIAFTELNYQNEYTGNIDHFLIKALRLVNTYNEKKLYSIEYRFKRIMKYCTDIFGIYAFRRYTESRRRGPINKALFELWSVCFSELTDCNLNEIVKRRDEFIEDFGFLLQENEFVSALKAGDRYSTARRIEMARKRVKEFLC